MITDRNVAVKLKERISQICTSARIEMEVADTCNKNADGSWGDIYQVWSIGVRIEDMATGNMVCQAIREADVDVEQLWKKMRANLKSRKKRTRRRMAAQRELDAE